MHVSVVTKTQLASLVAAPYNKVICTSICKLDDTSIIDCQKLLSSHWGLLLSNKKRRLAKLLEIDEGRLGALDDNLVV